MCSRYSLTSPPEAVRAYFGYADTPNFPARYNIAPTQPIAVVARDREGVRRFRLMRWGLLPAFVKDPKTFLDQRPLGGGAEEAFLPQRHALAALPDPGRRLL
jgi:putative SOS response-associated peptidase YedK